jgi:HSP20 family protein
MKWNLTKRTNENPIDNFHRSIDAIFDDFLSFKPTGLFESEWLPRIDVTEDSKAVHVKAEIPGIEEKDLNITLNGNILTISGEKKEERKEEKNNRSIVSERFFGSFSRTITLPEGVSSDKVRADFKNGVLTIEAPIEEAKQPKKIQINVQ